MTRLTTGPGACRSCEDEVDEKLVGAVADHREVGVFAVGHVGTELNLKLIFVFLL